MDRPGLVFARDSIRTPQRVQARSGIRTRFRLTSRQILVEREPRSSSTMSWPRELSVDWTSLAPTAPRANIRKKLELVLNELRCATLRVCLLASIGSVLAPVIRLPSILSLYEIAAYWRHGPGQGKPIVGLFERIVSPEEAAEHLRGYGGRQALKDADCGAPRKRRRTVKAKRTTPLSARCASLGHGVVVFASTRAVQRTSGFP